MMINPQSQIANLKAKITQLQAEKEQLRVLLHELLEAFYKSISQGKTSSTWTFDPNLAQLFKNLANFKTCSHQPTNRKSQTYPNECGWTPRQDIFAKMKGEHE